MQEKKDLESKKGTDVWTANMQERLTEIALTSIDIDETIEKLPVYKVKSGTEKLVHVKLIKGRRFNPNTGKEESKEYTQLFTYPEWQLFEKNAARLGYTILGILHNPYK